jgi:hypothetical protein
MPGRMNADNIVLNHVGQSPKVLSSYFVCVCVCVCVLEILYEKRFEICGHVVTSGRGHNGCTASHCAYLH